MRDRAASLGGRLSVVSAPGSGTTATKHYKTGDEQKQGEVASKRFEFRDFLGTSYWRDVNLKPLP